MATLLAKKAGAETPIATDDDHHATLAADPAVSAFPTGSSFGDTSNATTTSTNGSTAFGASTSGGFVSTGSFGTSASATTSGFGNPSGFGATATGSTTGFGSSSGIGASTSGSSVTGSVQVVQNQGESLKSGGGAMSAGGESTVALDKDATDWINKKMRPMMGWIYMLTCTCDFVIFPVLWSLLQALSHGTVTSQWQPLTLQGAGLYHIAMGAVLGIAAYGRTKEKVAGVAS
jgi:hypothetical protein